MLWKIFGNVKTFLDKCRIDNITAFAAQSAFFIILSAIPFLVVFSSLLKYTPISQDMLTTAVGNYMPNYISPLVNSIIAEVYNQSVGLISIAAVVAIWSSAKGLQYLGTGLNMVNNCQGNQKLVCTAFPCDILYRSPDPDTDHRAGIAGIRKYAAKGSHSVCADHFAFYECADWNPYHYYHGCADLFLCMDI